MKLHRFGQSASSTMIVIVIAVLATTVSSHYMSTITAYGENVHGAVESAKERFEYGITIISLFGTDGTDKTLEHFVMTFRLAPNSKVMLFEDMSFVVFSNNFSYGYAYNESINCSILSTYPPEAGYGAELLLNSKSHQNDRILRGDVARICFRTPESIPDNIVLSTEFLLGASVIRSFSTRFPRSIVHQTENLYP